MEQGTPVLTLGWELNPRAKHKLWKLCALHSTQPGINRKHVALEEVFPCHSQPRTILAVLSLEKWIFLSPVQENDGQEAVLHPDWKAQTAAWRVKARTYYGHHWFSSSCRLTSLGKYQTSSLMRPLILLSKVRKKKERNNCDSKYFSQNLWITSTTQGRHPRKAWYFPTSLDLLHRNQLNI